jgi:hypothetical protein
MEWKRGKAEEPMPAISELLPYAVLAVFCVSVLTVLVAVGSLLMRRRSPLPVPAPMSVREPDDTIPLSTIPVRSSSIPVVARVPLARESTSAPIPSPSPIGIAHAPPEAGPAHCAPATEDRFAAVFATVPRRRREAMIEFACRKIGTSDRTAAINYAGDAHQVLAVFGLEVGLGEVAQACPVSIQPMAPGRSPRGSRSCRPWRVPPACARSCRRVEQARHACRCPATR